MIKTISMLLPLSLALACSGSGGGAGGPERAKHVSTPSGQSSVTFEGPNITRTTQYGVEPNTGVYCSRYKNGEVSILLSEKGENRNNSGWLKDGLTFSFYRSVRPQDTTEIGTANTSVFAVVKEMPAGGTFNVTNSSKCSFSATPSGDDLDVRFNCPRLEQNAMSLKVYGWLKCKLKQMDF